MNTITRASCLLLAASCVAAGCNSTDQTGPRAQLVEVWKSALPQNPGNGWDGLPAVIGTSLFVEDGSHLVALNTENGQIIWSTAIQDPPVFVGANVVVSNAKALVGSGSINAFDATTGSKRWDFKPDSVPSLVIASADGQTYYTGQLGIPVVYALEVETGALRWRVNVGSTWQFKGYVYGVSSSGDTVYANIERFITQNGGFTSAVVVALDKRDGHELWRYETPTTSHGSRDAPIVFENLLIIDDLNGHGIFAIDRFSPFAGEKWRVSAPGNAAGPTTPSFLSQGTLFAGFGGGYFYAIDARSGAVKWSHQTFQWVTGVTACGGSAFANVNNIERYDAATGAITGHSASDRAPLTSGLVTDGSRVYVVGDDGAHAFAC